MGIDNKPALPLPDKTPDANEVKLMAAAVGRQIRAARCFGVTYGAEDKLREGYRQQLEKNGVNTMERGAGWQYERLGRGLGPNGNEFFDTRKMKEGEVISVDALTYFVNEVAPALGLEELSNPNPIELNNVEEVNRMIDMARMLGLSMDQELGLRKYMGDLLKKNSNVEVKGKAREEIAAERVAIGLSPEGGKVDAMRLPSEPKKLFTSTEVAYFVGKVLPKLENEAI